MLRAASMARIIIDAGHGGSARSGNSSAYGSRGPSGLLEKDVTLDIARQVVARLGGDAALTRTGDSNLSLGARAAHASRDGADVFVSIHANSGPPEMSGPETWVHPDAGAGSHRLAGGIQRALERLAGRYGGSAEGRRGPMAVLSPGAIGRRTAACLVEVDYLSNPRGEQRLGNPGERAAIGAAIAGAIREHVEAHRYGQQASVRIPPPAVINQVDRANGLVSSLRSGATDTSLGFGVRGATGRVRAIVHTTLPDGASGSVTVCLRKNGQVVTDQTFQIQGGLHMLPSHLYWNVDDGDYEISFVNGSRDAVRIDVDLQWLPAAHQGRHGGRYGVAAGALDRPDPDPFIIPDPAEYAGGGVLAAARVWLTWFGRYSTWRAGVSDAAYSFFPHTAICELEIAYDDGNSGFGTGFYIGPEKILSCGHNFKSGSAHATSVVVRPGKRPRMSVVGHQFAISDWRRLVHPNWAAREDHDFDLAVLRTPGLSAPSGQVFTLPTMTPAATQDIVVCGYGKFVNHPDPMEGQGQSMDGSHITHASDEQYHFPIQAIPGHSGSPVFWPAQENMVIAILTGPRFLGAGNTAPISDFENRGVRLTPTKNDWINRQ